MSDWRERANRRRDERQTIVPLIRAPSRPRKNTKRWCKGKVGVDHKPLCIDYPRIPVGGAKVLICEICHKHIEFYWPSPFRKIKTPPPSWVI